MDKKNGKKIDKEKLEKRAKGLYTLWRVLIALFSIGVSIYMGYQEAIHGICLRVFPTTFHFVLCAIVAVVFVPILVFVRKWAKAAEADELYAKATKMFWAIVIATAGTFIMNVISCFRPGLFS